MPLPFSGAKRFEEVICEDCTPTEPLWWTPYTQAQQYQDDMEIAIYKAFRPVATFG
jgi:hypothetical protein